MFYEKSPEFWERKRFEIIKMADLNEEKVVNVELLSAIVLGY